LTKKQVTIILQVMTSIASATASAATSASPFPVTSSMNARTRRLLEAPVAPTLLRLAAPNVLVMVLQAVVTTMDAMFVGWLGAEALAGVSLVYPLVMLMQTMSAGGMGGGVSSAVARALGAGRPRQAQALAAHAVLIALAMAALFTVSLLFGGPVLYRAMGGRSAALEAALTYSHVMFGGAIVFWLLNTLSSVVRGTGTMILPAAITTGSALLYLGLAPALVMGWGPFPRLGVAGTATANLVGFGLASLLLIGYLASPWSTVRLTFKGLEIRRELFWEILRVGAPGSVNTVLTNLTVVFITGLVGPFGTPALAGYGMGARLEYLQIPLVFGMGSALVAMVGTNVGAGQIARAERVAWTGAGIAAGVTASLGLLAAGFPRLWLGLFTADPQAQAVGVTYLLVVGPFYGFFGLGLALYFASQGAGRLGWPLTAGFLRLIVAAAGGWLAGYWFGWGLPGIFAAMAAALVVFGLTVAVAVKAGAWR
jgi:putative MATE family efflux protein